MTIFVIEFVMKTRTACLLLSRLQFVGSGGGMAAARRDRACEWRREQAKARAVALRGGPRLRPWRGGL